MHRRFDRPGLVRSRLGSLPQSSVDHQERRVNLSAFVSTIRAAYERVMRDNGIRDRLYSAAGDELAAISAADTPANRKAFVDERYTRLENAIDPKSAQAKIVKSQDKADNAHVRLTRAQAEALLSAPGVVPLEELRDTAAIALMLCTGIREAELCALEVSDLRQTLGGELALHVPYDLPLA